MAEVLAVCISRSRDIQKAPLKAAEFLRDKGIEGDSHCGFGPRHVSLLRAEDVTKAEKEAGFSFPPGSLAENLLVKGLPEDIRMGDILRVGDVVELVVLEKGKGPDEPHSYSYRGWCLLPTTGFFLQVRKGGQVRPGDPVFLVRKSE